MVGLISNFSEQFETDIVTALAWVIRRQRAQDQWYALQSIADWDNPISDKTIAWAARYAKAKHCRQLAKQLLAEC